MSVFSAQYNHPRGYSDLRFLASGSLGQGMSAVEGTGVRALSKGVNRHSCAVHKADFPRKNCSPTTLQLILGGQAGVRRLNQHVQRLRPLQRSSVVPVTGALGERVRGAYRTKYLGWVKLRFGILFQGCWEPQENLSYGMFTLESALCSLFSKTGSLFLFRLSSQVQGLQTEDGALSAAC